MEERDAAALVEPRRNHTRVTKLRGANAHHPERQVDGIKLGQSFQQRKAAKGDAVNDGAGNQHAARANTINHAADERRENRDHQRGQCEA